MDSQPSAPGTWGSCEGSRKLRLVSAGMRSLRWRIRCAGRDFCGWLESIVGLRFGVVDEKIEGLRIGHGIAVGGLLNGLAEENFSYRHFHFFSGQGGGDSGGFEDAVGNVARRVFAFELGADFLLQRRVQGAAGI